MNWLRVYKKRSRHFYLGDCFINSHNLSVDNVWILLGENWSWSLLGLTGLTGYTNCIFTQLSYQKFLSVSPHQWFKRVNMILPSDIIKPQSKLTLEFSAKKDWILYYNKSLGVEIGKKWCNELEFNTQQSHYLRNVVLLMFFPCYRYKCKVGFNNIAAAWGNLLQTVHERMWVLKTASNQVYN